MLLQHLGHSVGEVASGADALARFDNGLHQLVVTDLLMSGLSGQDVAAEIQRRSPTTPIVMYTGTATANPEWVDALITKPASTADFRETQAVWCICLVLWFRLQVDQKSFSANSMVSLASSPDPKPIETRSLGFAFSAMNSRPSPGGMRPAPSVLIRMNGLGTPQTRSTRS